MSCPDCDKATASRHTATPVRVGGGNVDVYGCAVHVKMLIDQMRGEAER